MKPDAALAYERLVSDPKFERMVYEVLREKGHKPCRPLQERLRELEESVSGGFNLPEGSLRFAAQYFKKSTRTIRSWCQSGVFPTATTSSGGHWRIPFDDIFKATAPANARAPKTTLGLRGRKRYLNAPIKILLVFKSIIRATESAKAQATPAEKQALFRRLVAHLEPMTSDAVLAREAGRLWVQAEFERIEEELRRKDLEGVSSDQSRTRGRGFSLGEFARTAGVDRTTVYRWRKAEPWLERLIRELQRRVRAEAPR